MLLAFQALCIAILKMVDIIKTVCSKAKVYEEVSGFIFCCLILIIFLYVVQTTNICILTNLGRDWEECILNSIL